MAKTIGGLKGDFNFDRGRIGETFSLASISDDRVRNSIQRGIARVRSEYGTNFRNIRLADLGGGVGGVYISRVNGTNATAEIFLNSAIYKDKTFAEISKITKSHRVIRDRKKPWLVPVKASTRATIIHELGHATWNSHNGGTFSGSRRTRVTKQIEALYKEFLRDKAKGRNPVSRYAGTEIDEFFAETFTQSLIGTKQTKYSKRLKSILKSARR